jgi:integrase/recombinase XerD
MALPVITLKPLKHNGVNNIALYFTYDDALIAHTRKLDGARWSASNKCWYIENSTGLLHKIFTHFKGIAWLDNGLKRTNTQKDKPIIKRPTNDYKKQLSMDSHNQLQSFKKLMVANRYSKSSIATYIGMLESFFGFYHNKKTVEIDMDDISRYNYEVVVKRNYSIVYQRQLISALKLFFKYTEGVKVDPEELERPRRSKKLPIVLSREEMLRILLATPNLKHRCILAMLYGSGLRISELINLKIADIDFARKQVFIRRAKRRKDRVVVLSEKIYGLLNDYLQTYKPDTYLFNGQDGLQYTAGSVRQFLARSVKAAGISKRVTPHTFRHTYATHLLESGVNLKYVQELLGHTRPETTQIYLHITKKQLLAVGSPLDSLLAEAEKEQQLLDKSNQNLTLSG